MILSGGWILSVISVSLGKDSLTVAVFALCPELSSSSRGIFGRMWAQLRRRRLNLLTLSQLAAKGDGPATLPDAPEGGSDAAGGLRRGPSTAAAPCHWSIFVFCPVSSRDVTTARLILRTDSISRWRLELNQFRLWFVHQHFQKVASNSTLCQKEAELYSLNLFCAFLFGRSELSRHWSTARSRQVCRRKVSLYLFQTSVWKLS